MIPIARYHTTNATSNAISFPSEFGGMLYVFGTWAGANARIEVSPDNVVFIPTSYTFNQDGIANLNPGINYVRANINLALAATNVSVWVNEYRI